MMTEFQYALHQHVVLKTSGESGEIIARAEYAYGEHSYLIRYCAGDGRQVESWWGESALELKENP